MSKSMDRTAADFYAETYDQSVPDWPGEIEFYQAMVSEAAGMGGPVLDLACGTGRVAIRLAQAGASVVGLDLSEKMLELARRKSAELSNIRWVHADMRSFQLPETFALVIICGHAFQNLNTAQEQLSCLAACRRHLSPGGRLVVHLDHQDFTWLGGLVGEQGGVFEEAEAFTHPVSGQLVRAFRLWSYEPSTQTAVCRTRWDEVDSNGRVQNTWETEPVRLHCFFRFEMQHLLARAGFRVQALYGDFARHALQDDSSEMIWVASPALDSPAGLAAG